MKTTAEAIAALKLKQEALENLQGQNKVIRIKLAEAREMVSRKQDSIERLRAQLGSLKNAGSVETLAHNTPEGMNDFFSSDIEEKKYSGFGRVLRSLILDHEISFDGRRVIDFGVGPGLVLEEVLRGSRPSIVVGADFSTIALDHARKRLPGARIVQWDIYERFEDRFDVAICTEVLEHLEAPGRALANLLQTIDPGGTMILTVPNGRIDRSYYHINFWSPESWRIFLQAEIDRDDGDWSLTTGTLSPQDDGIPRINFAVINAAAD
ncbi:MAG: hypothetical protein CMJ22_00100 [Phycisphaerae bacterium]|mgnify:CR=1 FL=1|nr:hypothetical protein [Phycisphaerae bacterium]